MCAKPSQQKSFIMIFSIERGANISCSFEKLSGIFCGLILDIWECIHKANAGFCFHVLHGVKAVIWGWVSINLSKAHILNMGRIKITLDISSTRGL